MYLPVCRVTGKKAVPRTMASSIVTGMLVLSHLVLILPSTRALGDSSHGFVLAIFGNDINIDKSHDFSINFNERTVVNLVCRYSDFEASNFYKHLPILSEVNYVEHTFKNLTTTGQSSTGFLDYTITWSKAVGGHIYRCWYREDIFIEVAVTFGSAEPPTTEAPSTEPPTTEPPTTEAPSTGFHPPTTGSTSSQSSTTDDNSTQFTGLNPLIYTISAVILLGTLAIVAIITCWIRARKSFHNRQLRPDSTPQDYLDYISDNEFTPLTTSEFLASLEQRPPTYNQSEEMESENRQNSTANASEEAPTRNPSQSRRLTRRQRRQDESERPDPSSSLAEGATGDDTGEDASTNDTGTAEETTTRVEQPADEDLPTAILIEVEVNTTDASATPTPEATTPTLEVATPMATPTPTREQINELDAAVEAVNERINLIRRQADFEGTQDGGGGGWEHIAPHWLDT